MLKRTPDLPALEDLNDGSITPAFIQLCRLFNILDVTITADPSSARRALALAQQQLSDDEPARGLDNELQRADISMTQQWMRIFLWQHALSVTNLRSTREEDEFSFSFPAKVAQSVLGNLSTLSRESLEAHGPGMVRDRQPFPSPHSYLPTADLGNEAFRHRQLARGRDDLHSLSPP